MNALTNQQIAALFLDTPQKVGLQKIDSPNRSKYDLYYILDNPSVKIAIAKGKAEDGTDCQYGYSLYIQFVAIIANGEKPMFLHVVKMKPNDSREINDWQLYDAQLFYNSREKGMVASPLIAEEIFWFKKKIKREEINFFVPEFKDLKLLVNGGIERIGVKKVSSSSYSCRITTIPTGWVELFSDVTEDVIANKYTTEKLNKMAEEKRLQLAELAEREQLEKDIFAAEHPILVKLGVTKFMMNIATAVVIFILLAYLFS